MEIGRKEAKTTFAKKTDIESGYVEYTGSKFKEKKVFQQLTNCRMDIATLTEVKKKGEGKGNEEYKNFIWFYSGVPKENRKKAGIAIVINKKSENNIKYWERISERIMAVEIDLRGHKVIILAVYEPTDRKKKRIRK